jgi:PPOX class probable F420-dependent enzyme
MQTSLRMAVLTRAQSDFLAQPFVGVVTTVRFDGRLHSTVVWVGVEDGDAVFATLRSRAKARHLERDPRVSLLVADPANPYRWMSVSGTAELSEEGADALVDRLATKYLGRDEYPWRRPGQTWVAVRIRSDRIETTGVE